MLDPITFLPLDSLRVAPPDERLLEAVRSCHGVRTALSCVGGGKVERLVRPQRTGQSRGD